MLGVKHESIFPNRFETVSTYTITKCSTPLPRFHCHNFNHGNLQIFFVFWWRIFSFDLIGSRSRKQVLSFAYFSSRFVFRILYRRQTLLLTLIIFQGICDFRINAGTSLGSWKVIDATAVSVDRRRVMR